MEWCTGCLTIWLGLLLPITGVPLEWTLLWKYPRLTRMIIIGIMANLPDWVPEWKETETGLVLPLLLDNLWLAMETSLPG